MQGSSARASTEKSSEIPWRKESLSFSQEKWQPRADPHLGDGEDPARPVPAPGRWISAGLQLEEGSQPSMETVPKKFPIQAVAIKTPAFVVFWRLWKVEYHVGVPSAKMLSPSCALLCYLRQQKFRGWEYCPLSAALWSSILPPQTPLAVQGQGKSYSLLGIPPVFNKNMFWFGKYQQYSHSLYIYWK